MKCIAIILTVFNRKETTLIGLRQLYKVIKMTMDVNVDVFMTDDGCTDGTAEAVSKEFPNIKIIKGDGNLYWSGGMRKAWDVAASTGEYDFYLWYNDDAMLYDDALNIMLNTINEEGDLTIVSGTFRNKDNGNTSYGGWSKDFKLVPINPLKNEEVFFMNGNFVLISRSVYKMLGNIDAKYKHSLGDWDYSARGYKLGIRTVITREFVGTTSRHDGNGISSTYDKNISFLKRLRRLYSPFNNPSCTWHFKRTHFGLVPAIAAIVKCHILVLFPQLEFWSRKEIYN